MTANIKPTKVQEYNHAYYEANKPQLSKRMADYYREHKEELNAYSRAYYRKRRETDREADMLARVKSRAKKLGLPFDLTLEDIVIPDVCPVLHIPIRREPCGRKGPRPDSPSLDRIVPSKGYVRGNVRVISNRANTLKCDATAEELELVLRDLRRVSSV